MRRDWIIYLALLLITAAVFWPVGHYDFINLDDPAYVAENPHIQQGLTLAGVAWAFRAVVVANWHPVTCLSLMLDCQLFGNNAGAHHLVNLLFHMANTLLLFLVWRRMTGELWLSALVAALFAWHPLHVESVAWISERKDVLSTFFGLLTLWAYTRYAQRQSVKEGKPTAKMPELHSNNRRGMYDYFLALLFFALGLMSKPMLVTLPFVLLLLDYWPLQRVPHFELRFSHWLRLVREKWPFFVLAAASCVVTFIAQKRGGAVAPLEAYPLSARLGNVAVTYVKYLFKSVYPVNLAVIYPVPREVVWGQVAGAVLVLAVITGLVWWVRVSRPYLLTGWLWYLGMLVPVIGLVQVGDVSMADRFTYLPLIGVFVMIIWGGKELGGRRPAAKLIRGVVMATALAACLVTTSRQLRYWRNSETLCRHALDVTTRNVIAYYSLGIALVDEGKNDAALVQLHEALAIAPGFAEGRCELARVLEHQGKIQEAINQYRVALHYNPDQLETLNNLAWLLATCPDPKFRNGAEAVRLAERACAVTHYQKTACIGTLAAAYAEAGQYADAIKTAERAIASATALGEKNLLDKNRQLLELYRAGHPYHETTEL